MRTGFSSQIEKKERKSQLVLETHQNCMPITSIEHSDSQKIYNVVVTILPKEIRLR